MTYLITALDAEARPFIEYYKLKRTSLLPYTLYSNDTTLLLVTGIGKLNAAMAVSALLGWCIPSDQDILINIGICGAPVEYTLGEALLIHQIHSDNRHYYPDILYTHPLREASLLCVDEGQNSVHPFPVDMESSGVFQASSRFFKLHQMAYLKIVSDHFTPDTITKEGVIALMQSHCQTVDNLITALQTIRSNTVRFCKEENDLIQVWKGYFTSAQGVKLEDALLYFRLKNPLKPFLFPNEPIPPSKYERSLLLERFISTLVS